MKLTIKDLRPEVAQFALDMERKLRENDHKPGWEGDFNHALFERLEEETFEVKRAMGLTFHATPFENHKQRIIDECADVANFAMMIADNTRNGRG